MANIHKGVERYVNGTDDVQARLRGLSKAMQTDVIARGLVDAVQPVLAAMVSRCPVRTDTVRISGRKLRPGELRAGLRAKVIAYPESGRAVGVVGPSGRGKNVAHLVEFGHLSVAPIKGATIRNGKARANATTHVPPHPFIRPAALTTLGEQRAAFITGANAGMTKALATTQ